MKLPKTLPIWVVLLLQQALWYAWFSNALFQKKWAQVLGTAASDPRPDLIFFMVSVTSSLVMARMTAWLFDKLEVHKPAVGALLASLLWIAFQGPSLAAFALFIHLPDSAVMIITFESLLSYVLSGLLLSVWRPARA